MTDTEIIALYWRRDERAISETDAAHGGYCRALASRLLASRDDGEECVNDTWLRAWNTMPPEWPEFLRAFLAKITRRLACDRLRRARAQKRGGGAAELALEELAECIPAPGGPEQSLMARELRLDINRFLASLGERERDVFLRRYFYCDEPAEIALRYGLRRGNVNTILCRTRAKLRCALMVTVEPDCDDTLPHAREASRPPGGRGLERMSALELFELIGGADERYLEHSERRAPRRRGMKPLRVLIAAAIIAALLCAAALAAAGALGLDFAGLIRGAFEKRGDDVQPGELEQQLGEGQWVYLNGENIAVILPESPLKILLSDDSGESWRAVETPHTLGLYSGVVTGAAFASAESGTVCYRYWEDAGPVVWHTADGGASWARAELPVPPEYAGCCFMPGLPVFDGAEGRLEISAEWEGRPVGSFTVRTRDGGESWALE